jgi:hypothetical protein
MIWFMRPALHNELMNMGILWRQLAKIEPDYVVNLLSGWVPPLKRNFHSGATFIPRRRTVMPMLFWLPAVIISEMWSMAWAEMPTVTRPIGLPED